MGIAIACFPDLVGKRPVGGRNAINVKARRTKQKTVVSSGPDAVKEVKLAIALTPAAILTGRIGPGR
jgi:hypothetical protein